MAEKNQLQVVVTDEALLKEVTFNYDQLKTSLTRKLKKYKDMVVTAENMADAKEDRAELNGIEKVMGAKSSEIQKKILNGFEVKMKELRGMVKETSAEIDAKVKALEQITKDKKRKDIEQLYVENIGGLKDLLPLNRIFNEAWLNVTVTPVKTDGTFNYKKVEAELIAIITKVGQELSVIDSLDSEYALQIKDKYLQTFDLASALAEKTRLEDVKKRLATVAPAQEKLAEAFISKEAQANPVEELPAWANASEQPKEYTLAVTGSLAQYNLIKTFLNTHKINYREVK